MGEPTCLFDVNAALGPAREIDAAGHGNIWFADHPIGGVHRLADGKWHTLLSFRVTDAAVTSGGALPAPGAGVRLCEIATQGPVLPTWRF